MGGCLVARACVHVHTPTPAIPHHAGQLASRDVRKAPHLVGGDGVEEGGAGLPQHHVAVVGEGQLGTVQEEAHEEGEGGDGGVLSGGEMG